MGFPTSKLASMQTNGFLIVAFFVLMSGECRDHADTRCTSKETCRECIAEDPACAWCSQENYTEKSIPRCNFVSKLYGNCDDLVDPKNSRNIIKDLPLSNKAIGATEEEAIQIKPQEIRIKLRPKSPETFSVSYRQAKDYPVDLYFVMDLSHTMKDDKAKLAELGTKFAEEMRSITADFRLGFGSFVDKVAAPYAAIHPTMLNEPCPGCASPYGFKNHMSLSSKTEIFAKEVHNSKVSGNLDSPEGTMDAIMQAVVCKEAIGWREKSRKLLVVSTDNDYHYAGDGKLGGIVEPNDCQCHLENGFYSKSTNQDYPSLSQVNRKIKENYVNLIFAVTKDQVDHYRNLSRRLVQSTTGILADDSSNVVQLIREQYEEISSSIEITDTAKGSDNIDISYSSSCLDGVVKETNVCKDLKVLDTVTFDVTVKYSFCPEDRKDWNQQIQIYPVGLNEYLTVYLEMNCECDCEKPGQEEVNSAKCNDGNGTYECGVCNCYHTRYGKECECDGTENQLHAYDAECQQSDDELPCSKRGSCICGKCECLKRENPEEKYYGKYCECNNFSCEQVDKKICNGHGVCDCGICRCHKGWSRSDCSCTESTQDCIDGNGNICGEKGQCVCGSCECDVTYYGRFCDDCPSCAGKCVEYSGCAECFLSSQDEEYVGRDCEVCASITVQLLDKVEVNETLMEKSCSIKDDQGCHVLFKYIMDDNNRLVLYLEKEKKCPLPPDALAIASGTIGSIVAAGIILLFMWKLLTTIHDRRELAKFEQERQKAKWDSGENPIYVQATSTFENPAYKGK